MSRAGYIPQMSSLLLPNHIAIFELLQKSGACALVCEPSVYADLSGCPVLNYPAIQIRDQDVPDVVLPSLQVNCSASDLVFIFQVDRQAVDPNSSHVTGDGSITSLGNPNNWLKSVQLKAKMLQ